LSAVTSPERLDNPRWWRIAVFGVGAIALVTGIAIIDALPVGVFHDDAMYVVLARSLATGHGYRYLNLPGAPVATQHPPGYPALLALVSWFAPPFPANLIVFKALNAVIGAASAVLVTLFARARAIDPAPAIALGVACGVSIPMLVLSSMVLSEPLFFLIVIALLTATERLVEREREWWRPIAIGIGIGASALVRLNGIALLPATLLVLGVRRRWRDAGLVTLATVVTMLPWQLLIATHTGVLPAPLRGDYESASSWWLSGLHTGGIHTLVATVRMTVTESIGMFAIVFSPLRGGLSHSITLTALAVLIVAAVATLRSRIPVTLIFLVGYLAIVAIWPYAPSRFLWAIWPLFLLLVTAAANWAWRSGDAREPRAAMRIALLAAFAWVAAGYATYETHGVRGRWWSSVSRSNAGRIAAEVTWVNSHTPAGALVAAEDEGAVFLYTGRRAVPVRSVTPDIYLRDIPAAEVARDGLRPILGAYPVDVVIAGSRATAAEADVLVTSTPALLDPGVDVEGGVVYRVKPRGDVPR
jgi:hypothetical protein